jgi:hypothetical protein
MGPDDPWSPSWRPDEAGTRIGAIRAMRHGALLAGGLFIPVALVAVWSARLDSELALLAVVVGAAGVGLLGAGLAPTAVGSRVDALVAGIALAIGAPVAAVTSMFIAALIVGVAFGDDGALSGLVMRGSVLSALRVAPLVIGASVVWVLGVRRSVRRSDGGGRPA